jgi:phage recombination protein Bet
MSDIVKRTAIDELAERMQVSVPVLINTLKACVMGGDRQPTNEEFAAFVVVANQYGLNPFTREIHAFTDPRRGLVPIVGVDGWYKIANRQESYDGCEFAFADGPDGNPVSCTCTIYVKGRAHPIRVTEYLNECKRNTPPWNTMTRRMLRHKAFIQTSRAAFGFAGIYDEDEARDIVGNAKAGKPSVEVLRDKLAALAPAKPIMAEIPQVEAVEPTPEPDAQAEPPADVPVVDADTGEVLEPVALPPVETWAQFESAAASVAAQQGIDPRTIAKRLNGLKLGDCGSTKRAGVAARNAVIGQMVRGEFTWDVRSGEPQ